MRIVSGTALAPSFGPTVRARVTRLRTESHHVASPHVVHRFGDHVAVLAPPYRASHSVRRLSDSDELPLGSIAIGMGDGGRIDVLAELTLAARRWPWAIPCVSVPWGNEMLERQLMLVSELRERIVVVRQSRQHDADQIEAAVGAVRRRSRPTARAVATWIARRLGKRELAPALESQFSEALEGTPASSHASVATYSRLFARHGPFTARDWRAVARLCVFGEAKLPGWWTDDELSPRTAGLYARKYLQLPYGVVAGRLGWEWILERALRVGRYL